MVVLALAAVSLALLATVGLCACVVSGQADDRVACDHCAAGDGARKHDDCLSRAA